LLTSGNYLQKYFGSVIQAGWDFLHHQQPLERLMNSPIPPKFTKRDDRKTVQQSKVKIRCRLQDLIDAQGMTRTGLASATGLTNAAIKGLCDNSAKRYDVDTLAVLCDFFGCDMGTLLEVIPKERKGS
jgi:DNA-binding Xre family transcriptional regulator